jgi:hypothetical protein
MQMRAEPPLPDAEPYAVRLSEPGDMVAAIPHLLGFRPTESLVLISLGGASGGRVGLTVRVDIPARADVPALAREVTNKIRTNRPAAVVLAVISEAGNEPLLGRARPAGAPPSTRVDLPHRHLVRKMVSTLENARIPVRDSMLVRGGRWWSYDCTRRCCSPEAGTPLPGGVSELEVASVAAGAVVAADREELRDRIAPIGGQSWARTSAAVVRIAGRRATLRAERGRAAVDGEARGHLVEAVAACAAGGERLTDDLVAHVLWGLYDVEVRNFAIELTLGSDSHAAEAVWVECTRRAPSPLDTPPATLVAIAAWLRGDGAMANVALEQALDSDPDYALARMLRSLLAACVPPAQLRSMLRVVLAEGGLDGKEE